MLARLLASSKVFSWWDFFTACRASFPRGDVRVLLINDEVFRGHVLPALYAFRCWRGVLCGAHISPWHGP